MTEPLGFRLLPDNSTMQLRVVDKHGDETFLDFDSPRDLFSLASIAVKAGGGLAGVLGSPDAEHEVSEHIETCHDVLLRVNLAAPGIYVDGCIGDDLRRAS